MSYLPTDLHQYRYANPLFDLTQISNQISPLIFQTEVSTPDHQICHLWDKKNNTKGVDKIVIGGAC